jgi:hypothetical protein
MSEQVKNPTTDVQLLSQETGIAEAEVKTLLSQLAYRKAYNARPDVVAKRKRYNQERARKMKDVRAALEMMTPEERAKYGL